MPLATQHSLNLTIRPPNTSYNHLNTSSQQPSLQIQLSRNIHVHTKNASRSSIQKRLPKSLL
ncbi:hypothetical protein M404DRAFT_1007837, partial [Pisolithus tinctorius Marx 270]